MALLPGTLGGSNTGSAIRIGEVNVKTGKVYIVWMDLGEITQKCFRYLAENFDEFIGGLTEQSIDD